MPHERAHWSPQASHLSGRPSYPPLLPALTMTSNSSGGFIFKCYSIPHLSTNWCVLDLTPCCPHSRSGLILNRYFTGYTSGTAGHTLQEEDLIFEENVSHPDERRVNHFRTQLWKRALTALALQGQTGSESTKFPTSHRLTFCLPHLTSQRLL